MVLVVYIHRISGALDPQSRQKLTFNPGWYFRWKEHCHTLLPFQWTLTNRRSVDVQNVVRRSRKRGFLLSTKRTILRACGLSARRVRTL